MPRSQLRRYLDLAEQPDRLGYDEFLVGEHHAGGRKTLGPAELFAAGISPRSARECENDRASRRRRPATAESHRCRERWYRAPCVQRDGCLKKKIRQRAASLQCAEIRSDLLLLMLSETFFEEVGKSHFF